MKVGYFELWTGLSGDMWVGACLDAGWPESRLQECAKALGLPEVVVRVERRVHGGLSGLGIRVESVGSSTPHHDHAHDAHDHDGHDHDGHAHEHHSHSHEQHSHAHEHHSHSHSHSHPHEPHSHSHSHAHSHEHDHGAHRSFTEIARLIEAAALPDAARANAIGTFRRLGEAEARIHAVPLDAVHFHEVGAADSIVDIVAACVATHDLGISSWQCGALPVSGGEVEMAHGRLPVPAPATALLMEGWPIRPVAAEGEFLTPTAMALLRQLAIPVPGMPALSIERVGFGAGTRTHPLRPNLVRLWIGEAPASAIPSKGERYYADREVVVLETQVDDLDPRILAALAERLLDAGARDVYRSALLMKKGRQGTLLTIVAKPEDEERLARMLFEESSTLGVRTRREHRFELLRAAQNVRTTLGEIRVKWARRGERISVGAEHDDLLRLAAEHRLPVPEVHRRVAGELEQLAPPDPATFGPAGD